jgi:hypothetical protein
MTDEEKNEMLHKVALEAAKKNVVEAPSKDEIAKEEHSALLQ